MEQATPKILKRTINSCIQMACLPVCHLPRNAVLCSTASQKKRYRRLLCVCPENGRIKRSEKPNMNRNYSNDKNLNVIYIKFINIKRFVSFYSLYQWRMASQMHRTLKLYARINLSATKRRSKKKE